MLNAVMLAMFIIRCVCPPKSFSVPRWPLLAQLMRILRGTETKQHKVRQWQTSPASSNFFSFASPSPCSCCRTPQGQTGGAADDSWRMNRGNCARSNPTSTSRSCTWVQTVHEPVTATAFFSYAATLRFAVAALAFQCRTPESAEFCYGFLPCRAANVGLACQYERRKMMSFRLPYKYTCVCFTMSKLKLILHSMCLPKVSVKWLSCCV